jgi:phosphohistidine phosphatase SixA
LAECEVMNALRRLLPALALLPLLLPLATSSQTPTVQAIPQGSSTDAPAAAARVLPPANALPAMVILVRHAEKSTEPKEDPTLTSAGLERAKALAATLADTGVTAIITTQWRRTKETAAPLAAARGITPEVVATEPGKPVEGHADAVAEAIGRHPGGVVLVVGHSNTIAAIVAALGGPKLHELADSAYSDLFLLTPGPGEARLVHASYGAASGSAAPMGPP